MSGDADRTTARPRADDPAAEPGRDAARTPALRRLAAEPDLALLITRTPTATRRVLVDAAMVLIALAAAIGILFLVRPTGTWWWIDAVGGALTALILPLRRRYPVALAAIVLLACTVVTTAGAAGAITAFTVALHRPFRTAVLVAIASVAAAPIQQLIRAGQPETGVTGALLAAAIGTTAVVAWSVALRSRRALLTAALAQAEREARLAERARIAREMHDVLAHRISLIGLHAGALEHRSSTTRAEVAEAAGVIRSSARAALQDLRDLLGVLRAPEDGQTPLTDVGGLLADVRAAGVDVRAEVSLVDPPPLTGRTVYRIAQEALTNAAKHAPGAPVHLTLAGEAGSGITLEVRNPLGGKKSVPLPGAGAGLVGIAERVELAGGRIIHSGPTGDRGAFRLAVWLPWPV